MNVSLHLVFSTAGAQRCAALRAGGDHVVCMAAIDPTVLRALDDAHLWMSTPPVQIAGVQPIDHAELVRLSVAAARVVSWP